jgi:hypothetical protein
MCFCGDLECSSCGPAQGNWRCPICHKWVTTGCEHIDEEGDCIKPEFMQLADEIEQANREAEDEYFRMISEGLED